MAYFPFYIDIKDKVWIVIGGGTIALRKIEVLSKFDANIIVIAPSICKEIYAIQKDLKEKNPTDVNNIDNNYKVMDNLVLKNKVMDNKVMDNKVDITDKSNKDKAQIIIHKREFQEEDINEADFVIAATDDEILNSHISELSIKNSKLVNVVDVQEECSFIFPAIVKNKELVVSISTSGNSPAMAVKVRKKIQKAIPEYYGELIETLGEYRDYIKNEVDIPKNRNKVYQELIQIAELSEGRLTFDMVQNIVNKYKS